MQPVGAVAEAEPDDVQRYHEYAYVGTGTPAQVPVVALKVAGICVEPFIVGGNVIAGFTTEVTATPLKVASQPVADGNRSTVAKSGLPSKMSDPMSGALPRNKTDVSRLLRNA